MARPGIELSSSRPNCHFAHSDDATGLARGLPKTAAGGGRRVLGLRWAGCAGAPCDHHMWVCAVGAFGAVLHVVFGADSGLSHPYMGVLLYSGPLFGRFRGHSF